jgi:hypothetical protein
VNIQPTCQTTELPTTELQTMDKLIVSSYSTELSPCCIQNKEVAEIPLDALNDHAAAVAWALIQTIKKDPVFLQKALITLERLKQECPQEFQNEIPLAQRLLQSTDFKVDKKIYKTTLVRQNIYPINYLYASIQTLISTGKTIIATAKRIWPIIQFVQGPGYLLLQLLLFLLL